MALLLCGRARWRSQWLVGHVGDGPGEKHVIHASYHPEDCPICWATGCSEVGKGVPATAVPVCTEEQKAEEGA